MATTHIGDTTWREIPGSREKNDEDGSITITRFYQGAITGGINGSGETSWTAFRASHTPGISDPDYGSDVRSIAYPSITKSDNATYTASITFRGGDFDNEGNSDPQMHKSKVSRSIEVVHPGGSVSWETTTLTYNAHQTVITYVRQGTPSENGHFSSMAYDGDITIDTTEIQEGVRQTGADAPMSNTQLNEVLSQGDLFLLDITYTRRSSDDGTVIYDVEEYWIKPLATS